MRIQKPILPDKKHGNVVIHTGKDPDLSPMSSSGQLSIGSYGDVDILQHGFANKIRQLQFGFCLLLCDTKPLNTQVFCPMKECTGEHVIQ